MSVLYGTVRWLCVCGVVGCPTVILSLVCLEGFGSVGIKRCSRTHVNDGPLPTHLPHTRDTRQSPPVSGRIHTPRFIFDPFNAIELKSHFIFRLCIYMGGELIDPGRAAQLQLQILSVIIRAIVLQSWVVELRLAASPWRKVCFFDCDIKKLY